MRAQPPYQPAGDYEAISTITFFPFLIVTRADSKYRSLRQALEEAKAAPGRIAYGSAGVGTTHHLAGELLARTAGVDLLHVAYRGDSASMTSLLAGDVPLVIAPPTAVLGQLSAGKVRALATTGFTRWSGLPDVPTAAEQGVKGYDVRSWAGLLAPKGTPRAIIDKLNGEVRNAVKSESVKKRLVEMGGEVQAGSPQDMVSMIMSDYLKWSKVIEAAKIPLR
jgi:tripartite-type tricarboxylate transporter receptor subunit TctC